MIGILLILAVIALAALAAWALDAGAGYPDRDRAARLHRRHHKD